MVGRLYEWMDVGIKYTAFYFDAQSFFPLHINTGWDVGVLITEVSAELPSAVLCVQTEARKQDFSTFQVCA